MAVISKPAFRTFVAIVLFFNVVPDATAQSPEQVDARRPVIIAPSNLDKSKPAPLIVVLHGYGGRGTGISTVWREAAAEVGAVIIAPTGPHAVKDAGFEWGRDVDEVDRIVSNVIKLAMDKFKIDEKRIILTGFSQGGYMTLNIGMKHPERFRGLVPVAAKYDAKLATPSTDSKPPRVFFMVGKEDRVAPSIKKAAKDYEAAKIPFKLNIYEGVGHSFPKDKTAELRKALSYILSEK